MAVWPSGIGARLQSVSPGSNSRCRLHDPVAQWTEPPPPKRRAGGSSPPRVTLHDARAVAVWGQEAGYGARLRGYEIDPASCHTSVHSSHRATVQVMLPAVPLGLAGFLRFSLVLGETAAPIVPVRHSWLFPCDKHGA
jgi:hypothetical protein